MIDYSLQTIGKEYAKNTNSSEELDSLLNDYFEGGDPLFEPQETLHPDKMKEHCDSCGTELEIGQIGDCDDCQDDSEDGDETLEKTALAHQRG